MKAKLTQGDGTAPAGERRWLVRPGRVGFICALLLREKSAVGLALP
ncbi:MAG: hypothetical protein O6916_00760 [bacterium]|nr:hypothetical protein [bacterium]